MNFCSAGLVVATRYSAPIDVIHVVSFFLKCSVGRPGLASYPGPSHPFPLGWEGPGYEARPGYTRLTGTRALHNDREFDFVKRNNHRRIRSLFQTLTLLPSRAPRFKRSWRHA